MFASVYLDQRKFTPNLKIDCGQASTILENMLLYVPFNEPKQIAVSIVSNLSEDPNQDITLHTFLDHV